jgi:mRNA interferase MazF
VIIQTNLLNEIHPSTLICPITTQVNKDIHVLRIHLRKNQLGKPSDVLVDQIRAIDNRRLINKLGALTNEQIKTLQQNLRIVLDL